MRKIEWENWNLKEEEQLDLDDENSFDDESHDEQGQYVESYGLSSPQIFGNVIENDIITTPFGIFAKNSPFIPSKRWSCWIGHTNFNIGISEVNILKKMPGVEALTVMGRYSFCIGIPNVGNLFDATDTKLYITESLCGIEDMQAVKQVIGKSKYWSVLIRSDGLCNCAFSTRDNKDYSKQLEKLEKLRRQHGGQIYNSKDYPELI